MNVVAVLIGGGIGTLVGARLPRGMRQTAMQAPGIVTLPVEDGIFQAFDTTSTQTALNVASVAA